MSHPENKSTRNRIQFILLFLFGIALIAGIRSGLIRRNNQKNQTFSSICQRAFDERDWDLLRTTAQEWRAWNPDSVDALTFLADAAQQTGNFSAAADYLLAVPDNTPKTIPSYIAAMKIQFGPLNRPLDGVETAKMILKIQPRAVDAHTGLMEFYATTLQRSKLIEQIRNAIELNCEAPSAYVYLFLVDTYWLGNASELNETWLMNYPDAEVFLVARALQLPEPGKGTTSLDKFGIVDDLLERFPHNSELLAYKIDVSIRLGKVDEVVRLLKNVRSDVQNDSRFWRFKGWAHLTKNQLDDAQVALNTALEIRPMDWDARNWLADVIRQRGDLVAAREQEKIVLQARRLRETITQLGSVEHLSKDVLTALQAYARNCGDTLVAAGLERRLHSRIPTSRARDF